MSGPMILLSVAWHSRHGRGYQGIAEGEGRRLRLRNAHENCEVADDLGPSQDQRGVRRKFLPWTGNRLQGNR